MGNDIDIVPENNALICGDEIVSWKIMMIDQAKLHQRFPMQD